LKSTGVYRSGITCPNVFEFLVVRTAGNWPMSAYKEFQFLWSYPFLLWTTPYFSRNNAVKYNLVPKKSKGLIALKRYIKSNPQWKYFNFLSQTKAFFGTEKRTNVYYSGTSFYSRPIFPTVPNDALKNYCQPSLNYRETNSGILDDSYVFSNRMGRKASE